MMLIKNKRSLFSKTIALCSDRRSHDRQTTKRRETMTEKSMIMNRKRNRKQCMVKQVLHRHRDPEGGKPVGYRQ